MFYQILEPLQIKKGNFNCQILKVLISQTQSEKFSRRLTNFYGNECVNYEGREFILKYGSKKLNGLVEYKEIKFLTSALFEHEVTHFIVKLVGTIENTFANDCGIIMEMAKSDAQSFLDDHRAKSLDCVYLLRRFEQFFFKVLSFLESSGVVYCDWKFENILIFDDTLETLDAIKLCDFGAIQRDGVKILNPQNYNPFFSSPFLDGESITPRFRDDWISVCYLFYKLNEKDLPWETLSVQQICPAQDTKAILETVRFLKVFKLTQLDLKSNIKYWPKNNKYFEITDLI